MKDEHELFMVLFVGADLNFTRFERMLVFACLVAGIMFANALVFEYTTLEAHDACVASGAMSQLLLWIGALEVVSAIKIDQMLRGSGSAPGVSSTWITTRPATGSTSSARSQLSG